MGKGPGDKRFGIQIDELTRIQRNQTTQIGEIRSEGPADWLEFRIVAGCVIPRTGIVIAYQCPSEPKQRLRRNRVLLPGSACWPVYSPASAAARPLRRRRLGFEASAGAGRQRGSELEWLRGRRQCSRGVTRSFTWLTTSSRAATGATWAARRLSSRRTRPGSGLACPISARKLTTSSMT